MNYEEMSDFEINKLVVDKHLHMFVNESKSRGRLDSDVWVFDSEGLPRNTNYNPCNNPSDAWPIILSGNIEITPNFNGTWTASCIKMYTFEEEPVYDDDLCCSDENPLRAACICFLKMKDSESK